MIDNEVEEFQLIRGKFAALQKSTEGALGRLPVKANESADETREATVALQRLDRRFVNSGLKENTLKLL